MRGRALRVLVPMWLLAVAALAQTPPPAAPTPTPTSAPAGAPGSPAGRAVAPSAEPPLAVSEPLPLNPIEAVAAGAVVSAGGKATKGEFVVAPIPISDPAVGSGLGLTAAYTFAKTDADDSSPPPVVGAGGFYTNNGSWGGAVATKLSLEEDRYRLAGAGFVGSINYDLFPAGADREGIAITQEIEFVAGEFLFGLGKRWYAGAVATWAATKVRREDDDDNVEGLPIPRDRLDSTLVGLGVTVERDSRDSMFYPTTGSRLQFVANHNDTGLGGDFTYTKTWLVYSKYLTLSEPVVLAVQGAGCHASEGGPFYSLCLFGTRNLLRGYTAGQYLDRWMVAAQAEGRWRFANRWIATGFAGIGVVEPALPRRAEKDSLPAAGVGMHWIAAPENLITVRAEYAIGEGGQHGFYVAIGQSF